MLTTRCPDCRTTFRITSVVLHKAAGQVRCGQCGIVFSAFDSLTDTLTGPAEFELQSTTTEPIPDEAVEQVLEENTPPPHVPWHAEERARPPEHAGWRAAAIMAAVALLAQPVHHFRADLVAVPGIGPALEWFYSAVGAPVPGSGEPKDFSIVDWVATAQEGDAPEAETELPGRLDISAGLRNDGATALPYPLLSLELTDRWEEVIGARVFTPEEYLGRRLSTNARIRPNGTIKAQLQLVDPGPDAYGFQVDICVRVDDERMRCKMDAVFE